MDRDATDTFIQDDHISFMLDTFNDDRRGFQFRVNPLGVQADTNFSELEGYEEFSWDAMWPSSTSTPGLPFLSREKERIFTRPTCRSSGSSRPFEEEMSVNLLAGTLAIEARFSDNDRQFAFSRATRTLPFMTRDKENQASVELYLPANSAFDFVAETFSGSITTDFEIKVTGKISPKEMSGVVNGCGATVKLPSFSGDIKLKKS